MIPCDVREATHVKINGHIEKIVNKWGIDSEGHLAAPSKGGFGVILTGCVAITMWQADGYFKES